MLDVVFIKTLLRLRALPDGLPRGNTFPYFTERMKYYYNLADPKGRAFNYNIPIDFCVFQNLFNLY